MWISSEDDIDEFIYSSQPPPNLGIVDRSESVTIGETEIEQSISLLHQHSTGAVVWRVTPRFARWIKASEFRPTHVVELGSGTGALARLLAPEVVQWIATDQRPLLKLCRRNTAELGNVVVQEFDWEQHEFDASALDASAARDGVEVARDHVEVARGGVEVAVVACDTVYNSYLIQPFLGAVLSVWKQVPAQIAFVAVQLRELGVLAEAFALFLEKFRTFEVREIEEGYVVVLLRREALRASLSI